MFDKFETVNYLDVKYNCDREKRGKKRHAIYSVLDDHIIG